VKNWLVENVHSYGDLYDAPELIRKISGKGLNVKPYLNYLNEKYSNLYGF
jgi:carboxypeptidase Taq